MPERSKKRCGLHGLMDGKALGSRATRWPALACVLFELC